MKKIMLIIVSALLFVSCKTVLLKVKGVKDPKLETYASTQKYLLKNNVDTTRLVYFKDLQSFGYASKKKLLSIPDAFFFDKNGNFVDYRKSVTDCNAKIDGFINDLSTFNEAKKDSTKTLKELKRFLASCNNNLVTEKKADINVYITWAKFAGALNREKAFAWVKLLDEAKQKGINVNYYLLNCDYQESWNMTKKEKEDLGLN